MCQTFNGLDSSDFSNVHKDQSWKEKYFSCGASQLEKNRLYGNATSISNKEKKSMLSRCVRDKQKSREL